MLLLFLLNRIESFRFQVTQWDVTKTRNGEWGTGNGNVEWEIENGKIKKFNI